VLLLLLHALRRLESLRAADLGHDASANRHSVLRTRKLRPHLLLLWVHLWLLLLLLKHELLLHSHALLQLHLLVKLSSHLWGLLLRVHGTKSPHICMVRDTWSCEHRHFLLWDAVGCRRRTRKRLHLSRNLRGRLGHFRRIHLTRPLQFILRHQRLLLQQPLKLTARWGDMALLFLQLFLTECCNGRLRQALLLFRGNIQRCCGLLVVVKYLRT
jgi:hypothetical protein